MQIDPDFPGSIVPHTGVLLVVEAVQCTTDSVVQLWCGGEWRQERREKARKEVQSRKIQMSLPSFLREGGEPKDAEGRAYRSDKGMRGGGGGEENSRDGKKDHKGYGESRGGTTCVTKC